MGEEKKATTPTTEFKQPVKITLMMNCGRLGAILSNISLVLCCIAMVSIASVFISAFAFVLKFLFIIITLGIVLLIPGYWESINSGPKFMEEISSFLSVAGPYLSIFATVTSILSIIFLAFDRTKPHPVRIVFSCIIAVISLFITIFAPVVS